MTDTVTAETNTDIDALAHALAQKVASYNPEADEEAIVRACRFGAEAHQGQMRASGEPYITHPIAVADSLADLKLDNASILTAILHDTVEDTDVTLSELKEQFGEEVSTLVDGVTKLTQLEAKSEQVKQAENFRKLVIAMSEDIRVLLVKLCDRLHNMKTLHYIKSPEKRQRISRETLDIYATLAERIGMRRMKDQLQDLAFAELYTEARESIVNRLKFLRSEGQEVVDKTVEHIQKVIRADGLPDAKVTGREKRPYSIWKKMELKNISFEQLADIMAFRIIVEDVGECYQALGVIHSHYHMIHGHFKDYISTPKPNGYRSLHTAVMGPLNQRIEIQIRTHEMHEYAEYGVAAHWHYKQGEEEADPHTDGKRYRWIRELLEILEQTAEPEEFMENTKLEMYHDQVFCFSPRGDLLELPKGATPVDFAFAVHSDVGFTCVGAKVNGRIVPLRTPLENGDQVEIICSKTQTPSPGWEQFVVTGKARSEIRRFLRTQKAEEYRALGRAILSKTFQEAGYELSDKALEKSLDKFAKKTVGGVYAAVGEGTITRKQVLEVVYPESKNKPDASKGFTLWPRRERKPVSGHAIPLTGLIPGMAVHYAGCCHPLPGDKIVGIVSTGRGVTIHTADCTTLENFTDVPERWIDVGWAGQEAEKQTYVGRIKAVVGHKPGALAAIANIIAREKGNISNLKVLSRSSDFFELIIDIEVSDVEHLTAILAALRKDSLVQAVERHHE